MKKIAIIYASHDKHTKKISETIRSQLSYEADLLNVIDCNAQTINNYDVLIFGSAVRYGKHLKQMVNYLTEHRSALMHKKTAFFSINVTARKAHRNTPETCNYIKKMLLKLDWQPDMLDVFAGKIDYPNYRFFDKQIIRFIMWLTKGPTDINTTTVFTDWERVRAFSSNVDNMIDKL